MPRWLPRVLERIRKLAALGAVRLTYKAEREAVALGLGLEDVRDVLGGLGVPDWAGRLASEVTGEWMYLFKPELGGHVIYTKIVLRERCVVVSFHEDDSACNDEED